MLACLCKTGRLVSTIEPDQKRTQMRKPLANKHLLLNATDTTEHKGVGPHYPTRLVRDKFGGIGCRLAGMY